MRNIRVLVIGLALSLVSLVGTLIALEAALQTGLLTPRTAQSTAVRSREKSRMTEPDFRAPGFALEKKEGAFRILVVGDSFAWGDGVHYEDAFPNRLDVRLNAVAHGDQFEVINWSRPGWNTVRQVRSLESRLDELNPDLLILGFVLNDPEPADRKELERMLQPVESRLPGLGPSTWLFDNSRLYALIWTRLESSRMRRELSSFYRSLYVGEHWEACQRALKRMRNLARRQGIPMVLVIFPVFDSPMDQRYRYTDLHKKIREEGELLKMQVLDLLGSYSGMDVGRLAVVPISNAHPNEIAHRVAAENIRDFLIRRRLIPPVDYEPSANRRK